MKTVRALFGFIKTWAHGLSCRGQLFCRLPAALRCALFGGLLTASTMVGVAQPGALTDADVSAIAQGLVGTQSPLFLLGGLDVQETNQILSGREAYLSLEGLSTPDGPDFDTPVILYLEMRGDDLIRVPTVELPGEWVSAEGHRLQMGGPRGRGPTFKAVWSRRNQGFQSFDLNLGDVTYQGEGISYRVPNLRFRLDTARGLSRLNVRVNQWDADYGRAMGGRETARNFAFEVKAPTRTLTPSALLSLANRLMGTLLEVPMPPASEAEKALLPNDLHGVSLSITLGSAAWDTASPPAAGGLTNATVTMDINEDSDSNNSSRVQATLSVDRFDARLADNRVGAASPLSLSAEVTGLEPRALVHALFGVGQVDGEQRALVRQPSSFTLSGQVEDLALDVPLLSVEHQLGRLMGHLAVELGDSQSQPAAVGLVLELEDVVLPDFGGREAIEPMATSLLLPMLPSKARMDISLQGIESEQVATFLNKLVIGNIRDALASLPRDLDDLTLVLGDNYLTSSLIAMSVDGAFQLGQPGRIPVRGELSMQTGSLVPLQTAIQQALTTPIPSVVQALSATILVTTVLQGYAVPAPDGRFNFDLRFDGGLPTINGRELPRIPGL